LTVTVLADRGQISPSDLAAFWPRPGELGTFTIQTSAGTCFARRNAMKLMPESYNWFCALLHAACSIAGQAKSPTILLPLRAEPLV
jgi:hypothetical protein